MDLERNRAIAEQIAHEVMNNCNSEYRWLRCEAILSWEFFSACPKYFLG